jgi:N-acetylglucosamine kinase-like BadF-type ATPase
MSRDIIGVDGWGTGTSAMFADKLWQTAGKLGSETIRVSPVVTAGALGLEEAPGEFTL